MQKICIIIPCYNESKRIQINEFDEFIKDSENIYILFVNDGSTDNTLEILNSFRSKYELQIKVLNLIRNQGKAEAVRNGMLESIKWIDFDAVGYMDADLSTPLFEITTLKNAIFKNPDYKIAFGSRVKTLGTKIIRNPFRHYLGRIFATFASIILHLAIYDTQCGAKLIKSEIIPDIFSTPFKSKWFFDLEIFHRIMKLINYERAEKYMIEIPLYQWIDKGKSKISLTYWLKVPYELLKLYIIFKRDE